MADNTLGNSKFRTGRFNLFRILIPKIFCLQVLTVTCSYSQLFCDWNIVNITRTTGINIALQFVVGSNFWEENVEWTAINWPLIGLFIIAQAERNSIFI